MKEPLSLDRDGGFFMGAPASEPARARPGGENGT